MPSQRAECWPAPVIFEWLHYQWLATLMHRQHQRRFDLSLRGCMTNRRLPSVNVNHARNYSLGNYSQTFPTSARAIFFFEREIGKFWILARNAGPFTTRLIKCSLEEVKRPIHATWFTLLLVNVARTADERRLLLPFYLSRARYGSRVLRCSISP